jgi:allophanate hydrolase subunit 2
MRITRCLAAIVVGGAVLCGFAPGETDSYRASLAYSELISYGIVNAYSTNVLAQIGFRGGCLTKEDGLDAVERNLAFVKVLERYAHGLKRVSTNEDEGAKKLTSAMCEALTYLEQQTQALKEWILDPKSDSARLLYEKYTEKAEKKIESMLTG